MLQFDDVFSFKNFRNTAHSGLENERQNVFESLSFSFPKKKKKFYARFFWGPVCFKKENNKCSAVEYPYRRFCVHVGRITDSDSFTQYTVFILHFAENLGSFK